MKLFLLLLLLVTQTPSSAKEKQSVVLAISDSIHFENAKQSYDFYNYVDTEVIDRGIVVKEIKIELPHAVKGEVYEINSKNNDFESYRYIGFIKTLGCYAVRAIYPNSEQSFLINKQTGLLVQSLPEIVPTKGKYLITYDQPTADSYHGKHILTSTQGGIKIYHTIKDERWYTIDIVWGSRSIFFIKAIEDNRYRYFKVIIK
jgi:hypothetical protein